MLVVFPRDFQWHDMASKMSHTQTPNPKPPHHQTSSWTFWGPRPVCRNTIMLEKFVSRRWTQWKDGSEIPVFSGSRCCVDGGFTAMFSILFMEMTQLEKYTIIYIIIINICIYLLYSFLFQTLDIHHPSKLLCNSVGVRASSCHVWCCYVMFDLSSWLVDLLPLQRTPPKK